jgi:signal transduction histidine kinase
VEPPSSRASVDDRTWRSAARLLSGLGGLAGVAGAPSVALGAAAGVVLVAYGALCLLTPTFGGVLRRPSERTEGEEEPRPSGLPWPAVAGVDLVVFAIAAWLLVAFDLREVAFLLPLGLAAVHAHEQGLDLARITVGIMVADLVVLVVLGAGRDATWRDAVALVFVAALAALAALAGGAIRAAEAVSVEDRATVDVFRQTIITTVSHELRTPLTIIQGITWALVNRWDQLQETQKLDLLDTLGVNIASLDASILHFLDAGRLTRGEWEVRAGWVDVAPLLDRVAAKLDPMLAGYALQRRVDADRVWADEEALFRVIELLLVNACRFSPPSSPIGVRVSGGGTAGWDVAVTDKGQGIPPKDLPHVFEPLWRADVQETGVSRGAGLGLAIVKELADRHGGRVGVTSARGRGSTFRMWLPPAPDDAAS